MTEQFKGLLPSKPVRMFYIDDSGSVDTGWIVYSWIECAVSHWSEGLRGWLNYRAEIFAHHGIPTSRELHCTEFVRGKGNPSINLEWNRHKKYRSEVVQQGLRAIQDNPALTVGTIALKTEAVGKEYSRQRGEVYQDLVLHLDARLAAADEVGLLVMDGRPVRAYYDAHRGLKLADRSIIEDPFFVEAHRSQWLQMADFVAWTAYQYLRNRDRNHPARGWYPTYLRSSDVNNGPLEVGKK